MSLIITEKELEERKSATQIVYKRMGVPGAENNPNGGRHRGDKNIIPFVKELISDDARNSNATLSEVSEAWDVSESSVQNAKEGRLDKASPKGSDAHVVEKAIDMNQLRKDGLIESTTIKLIEAMGSLNMKKLKKDKPIVQSQVIRNLSGVLKDLTPESKSENNFEGGVHYHVHVPKPRDLDEFSVVEVSEKPTRF